MEENNFQLKQYSLITEALKTYNGTQIYLKETRKRCVLKVFSPSVHIDRHAHHITLYIYT